jgi:hypothetical protein
MASDMEVRAKQKYVIEFLHAEEIAPFDIDQHLPNIYGDRTVYVSKVRRWVVCFSSGDSNVRGRPRSMWLCTAISLQNEEHLNQHNHAKRQIMSRELCTEFNSMCSIQCRQHWNIANFVPGGSHGCSHRNIKATECKSVRTY